MADFRRVFTALAVLALMAGLASAQIGTSGSGQAGVLQCTANAAATPQIRIEGLTELLGDILITCTGGNFIAPGGAVPTTNIIVYVSPNYPITSRLISSTGGNSEVVLIIDDAGAVGLSTGAIGGYGPKANQVLCNVAGGCPTFVGTDNSGQYLVPVNAATGCAFGACANAPNVYPGTVGTAGVNTVGFFGVPVLPPVTTGVSRTFRITNIRYPATQLALQATVSVFLSTNPSQNLPITQSALTVATVGQGLKTSVNTPGGTATATAPVTFQQCVSQGATASLNLIFAEGFATSFKTRVVPLSNTTYAAEGTNTAGNPAQNIPGGQYGGFAANSESGFIFSQLTNSSSSIGIGTGATVAGLADFGTRLKAIFTNIPAGITLYVSGTNIGTIASPIGGTSTTPTAVLVGSETGIDGTNFAPASGGTSASAVQIVPNSSGVATAIWEVTNANPNVFDTLTFTVFVGFVSNPGSGITATNPYGLPQITNILGNPVNNVALSFAPEPSQGAFAASAGSTFGTNPIPRFVVSNPFSATFASIILCQTTLLYPFVTANPSGGLGQGFDTGIAIANTSRDPFTPLGIPTTPTTGTLAETGSCTLYPYGVTISATGAQTAAPAALPGCDTVTNPVAGTNCFPVVSSGSVQTVLASQVFPGFQGYVIAVCNFQYAHGYAAVTDLGLRGLFSSYLAVELNKSTTVGQPRGVSIEFNAH